MSNQSICLNESITTNCDQPFLIKNYSQNLKLTSFQIIQLFILAFLLCIGICGNLSVILCVVIFKNMRTVSNIFLLNLACSDFLVFIICQPFHMISIIQPNWGYGLLFCQLTRTFQGVTVGVSILTLTSICIERYVVIVHDQFRLSGQNHCFHKRYLTLWVIAIWCVSGLIVSPLFPAHEVILLPPNFKMHICSETWHNYKKLKLVFTITVFSLFYIIPLLFMTILYSKIAIHLRNSTRNLTDQTNMQQTQSNSVTNNKRSVTNTLTTVRSTRERISRFLLILNGLFAFFWLPYHITNITIDSVDLSVNLSPDVPITDYDIMRIDLIGFINGYIAPISQLLAYGSNALNPMCTLIISKKFRMAFNRIRRCYCSDNYVRYNRRSSRQTAQSIIN